MTTSLEDIVETLLKSWPWGCPGTEATRKRMHPKLDPIVNLGICDDTELIWATARRETGAIVGISKNEVV